MAADPSGSKDQPGGIIELRTPVPKAADQERAAKLLHEVFKDDFAQAKLPAARLELAEKLIKQSQDTSDDVVFSYVLLREAAASAMDAQDPKATERIIGMISARFIINPLEEISTAFEHMVVKPHVPSVNKDIASITLGASTIALRLDQYEVAQKLADTALTAVQGQGCADSETGDRNWQDRNGRHPTVAGESQSRGHAERESG